MSGMENMDQAPFLIARGRWGYRMGDGQLYDSVLRDAGCVRPYRIASVPFCWALRPTRSAI
jgi:hypothetical protein